MVEKTIYYISIISGVKYDGEYIFNYLLKNGYECIKDKKDKHDKSFCVVISGEGNFYAIEIYFQIKNARKVNKVTIYDSLKILNFSVEKIAKSFDLPIRKLKIDYKEFREVGHKLTQQEIDYIRNDVEIMARALEIMFNEKLNKMTIGACALDNYRKKITNFKTYYPNLEFEIDQDIRKSYKGGFTYLSPLYKEKEVMSGIVLDVNSLYPSVMRNCLLPFGKPIYYDGKYEECCLYPLYIQRISCIFKLKKGKIPTIQIKNNPSYFVGNEYLESSEGLPVVLTLTNIDLELFLEHYDVEELKYLCGWKFKAKYGLFNEYVDYWSDKKIESKKNDNKAMYTICKLLLNSLYGKFSKNPKVVSKYPYINEEGSVSYALYPSEIGNGLYIPMGSFITSYARFKTVSSSQLIRDYSLEKYGVDYYIYSDT